MKRAIVLLRVIFLTLKISTFLPSCTLVPGFYHAHPDRIQCASVILLPYLPQCLYFRSTYFWCVVLSSLAHCTLPISSVASPKNFFQTAPGSTLLLQALILSRYQLASFLKTVIYIFVILLAFRISELYRDRIMI